MMQVKIFTMPFNFQAITLSSNRRKLLWHFFIMDLKAWLPKRTESHLAFSLNSYGKACSRGNEGNTLLGIKIP
ncbi:MAG: hypothetical protein OXM55_02775 [Bdellovibrionales bacterium]|nr:hypothetical protein [Bdellovibrionales bacterium]